MSIVNSTTNSSSLYNVQANSQVQNTQKVHHHHHKDKSQDSDAIQVSNQSSQLSGNKFTNGVSDILNSLVTNGTITQDQETSIQSAFQAAKQANSSSGTYNINGSNAANPISSLVANGTISQSQADSIQSAFKAAHHNHHRVEQTQDAAQTAENSTGNETDSLIQALEDQDPSLLGSSSNGTEEGLLQSLENPDLFASNN